VRGPGSLLLLPTHEVRRVTRYVTALTVQTAQSTSEIQDIEIAERPIPPLAYDDCKLRNEFVPPVT
jgi:hypothetical protein